MVGSFLSIFFFFTPDCLYSKGVSLIIATDGAKAKENFVVCACEFGRLTTTVKEIAVAQRVAK